MISNQLQQILNHWFGIDNNTSATIIITLIIFIIGIIFTETIKSLDAFVQRKRIKKICKINLKNLEIGLKKQERAYQKYINSLRFDNRHGLNFSYVQIPSINAFQELGYNKIYDAFFYGIENISLRKNKLKAFQKLWSIIIVIPIWQSEIKSFVSSQLEKFNEWNDIRNKNIQEFNKLSDCFLCKYVDTKKLIDPELKKYTIELDKIRFNIQNHHDFKNPEILERILVQPTLKLNRVTKNIEIIHDLNDYLLTSSLAYTNMKQILETSQKQTFLFCCSFKARFKLLKIIENIL